MSGELQLGDGDQVTKPGRGGRIARLPRSRWGYAILLVVTTGSLVAIAILHFRSIDRELTEIALSRRVSVAGLAAATLSEKFARLVDLSVSLATRVRFRELVGEGRWVEAVEILREVPRDFSLVERLFLADVDGTLRADVPELPGVRGRNFSGREWYQGVRREWQPYVSPLYLRTAVPQLMVFAVAAPIRGATGNVAGILVLQIRAERLLEWVKAIEIGPHGFAYVVDSEGRLAFHTRKPSRGEFVDLSAVPIVRRSLRGEQGVSIGFDQLEGEDQISAYAPVPGYGWGVITQQPTRASMGLQVRNEQLGLLLTGYGLILLLGVSAVYFGARIAVARRRAEDDRRMRSELERMVAERTAQLEAANKELESFSYSVSHDLRSPLRAIDGFARILAEDYGAKVDDEGRRLLGVVRDSSQKMGQLIDDLLAFSRLGRKPVSAAPTDMARLVEEVVKDLAASGGGSPRVELKALPAAHGDAVLLKQAWANLIANAVKFSSKRERPTIEVSGGEHGAETVYCVKDNGVGFDMRFYDKLFGVFQRLHHADEFPGTGVGLAIVQRVVSRHGGRVWAEGKVGEGAAFYFSIPKGVQDGHV
ncbi:MAG TPA: cache domain-containing protein [Steroidobacteraceae bacterium]|nr:cache domain-containing protein [Steroidobacteraceae bacterium]